MKKMLLLGVLACLFIQTKAQTKKAPAKQTEPTIWLENTAGKKISGVNTPVEKVYFDSGWVMLKTNPPYEKKEMITAVFRPAGEESRAYIFTGPRISAEVLRGIHESTKGTSVSFSVEGREENTLTILLK